MMNTAEKLLENLIRPRLEEYFTKVEGIAKSQYGFQKNWSTACATKVITRIAHKAIEGKRWQGGYNDYCAIMTMDIKKAYY